MLKIWIAALKSGLDLGKGVTVYENLLAEAPKPTLSTAVKWMAASGVITGVLEIVLSFVYDLARGRVPNKHLGDVMYQVIANPIGIVIVFVISSFIILRIAQVLGGEGNLDNQSYLLAAAGAPMFIIQDVLRFMLRLLASPIDIPAGINILVFFAPIIYTGWLSTLALRASHQYSGIRAGLSVLIFVGSIIAFFLYGRLYLVGLLYS